MAQKIESLRGMEDILPGEVEKWQWLEEKVRIFFGMRGYREIRTPILEYTELFNRSVGEASDILHKEMFAFEDRGGRNIALRPEMTASVARAVIEKGLLTQAKSLRLYYLGPMFRAERPQAGRKRHFHQMGIEIINESGWRCDFEAIVLLHDFLDSIGIKNMKFRLNDLGSSEDQKKAKAALQNYFGIEKSKLCPDCHYRLEKNVLRIFDCKNPSCQPVIEKAPWEEIAPLSSDFKQICYQLEARAIPFQVQRRLVRGLDYYNGTVFEVSAEGLGAQDALAGGGRYDRLYNDLGGKPAPCTGFALGMERLMMAAEASGASLGEQLRENFIYLGALDGLNDEDYKMIPDTAGKLSSLGFRTVIGGKYSNPTDHLKLANKIKARYFVMLGQNEMSERKWLVKDLDKRTEEKIAFGKLFSHLKGIDPV